MEFLMKLIINQGGRLAASGLADVKSEVYGSRLTHMGPISIYIQI